jgi:preprotein translocase subunit SecA
MTGTAMTEAEEFYEIYKLDVVSPKPQNPVDLKLLLRFHYLL